MYPSDMHDDFLLEMIKHENRKLHRQTLLENSAKRSKHTESRQGLKQFFISLFRKYASSSSTLINTDPDCVKSPAPCS